MNSPSTGAGSQPRTAPVDAVLFDFGGTLDAPGMAWKERFHALYAEVGIELTPEAFAPHFYTADDLLVGGVGVDTGLRETVARLVDGLGTRLGPRAAAAGTAVAERFMADSLASIAIARNVLGTLRREHRIGIVSNFYGNLDAVCAEVGLADLIDVAIDSEVAGASKPDPRLFTAATDALGCAPGASVFVGDSLRRDKVGAEGVGMRFIWLASPTDRKAHDGESISDIRELAELLA